MSFGIVYGASLSRREAGVTAYLWFMVEVGSTFKASDLEHANPIIPQGVFHPDRPEMMNAVTCQGHRVLRLENTDDLEENVEEVYGADTAAFHKAGKDVEAASGPPTAACPFRPLYVSKTRYTPLALITFRRRCFCTLYFPSNMILLPRRCSFFRLLTLHLVFQDHHTLFPRSFWYSL